MLINLIIRFSYPGVFLVLLATGLGLPIPEELPIVIAAMMARWEVMHWWGALLSCLGGALAGDMLVYGVGRHFGRRVLEWPPARRMLTPEREARVMEAYRRHGLKFVILARLVMGLRAATFLTAGPKETRAWEIRAGATAPEAAGVIHTDFQKGFIKAEIVSFDDLVETGSVPEARAKGKARM